MKAEENIIFDFFGVLKLVLLLETKNSNWNYYLDKKTNLTYYIAKDEKICKSGIFGDIEHFNNNIKVLNIS